MGNYFDAIKEKLQEALKKEIANLMERTNGDDLYSMALVTDSDFVTLFLAGNSEHCMREKDLEYAEDMKDFFSAEVLENVKAGKSSFVKWSPSEWGYSDERDSELRKISNILFDMERNDSALYAEKADDFLEMISECFSYAISQTVTEEYKKKIVFFVSVTDDDRTVEIERHSAQILNAPDVYERYGKRQEGF